MAERRALVAGWFSFEQMGATAGDLMARDVVCDWLGEAGHSYDVALAPPFSGGLDWKAADPRVFSHVVFVCGPFGNGGPLTEFLEHFRGCQLVGVDLTMLDALQNWNPFDVLFERDSSATSRPDISLLCGAPHVPVVGTVLIDTQPEYGRRDKHADANASIQRLLESREAAVVRIDTRLDENQTGLRTPAEVESLIARMDAILTTRLHGTVLAIKNGVPPVVIDPVAGGDKVLRQARTLGWSVSFSVDEVTEQRLRSALDYCLSEQARVEVVRCREVAIGTLRGVREQFIAALSDASHQVT